MRRTPLSPAAARRLFALSPLLWGLACVFTVSAQASDAAGVEQFKAAWEAARVGDHDRFARIKDGLHGYLLFPYLQYEDFRNRRSGVAAAEMSSFLDDHRDWAFAPGLRAAWLKSLAQRGRWEDLVRYSAGVADTVLRCQRARGRIILGQTEGLLAEAGELWVAGRSQPRECDPLFSWLIQENDGIPESLAQERIRLAILAGNRRLVAYLARFVPEGRRRWLEDWQKLQRARYSGMEQMRFWPDEEMTRLIALASLQWLAQRDAAMAARKFERLEKHFGWKEAQRAGLLRDIALYSAVALEDDTAANMARVPADYRDARLLEWWARFLLSRQDWAALGAVIGQMPAEQRNDDRWRYWLAQAELRTGQEQAASLRLRELAGKANYYGFLAADGLGLAYSICPLQPRIDSLEIERVAAIDGFRRALELRKAELDDWAANEWSLAANRLRPEELKIAAALAARENWIDRAIFALGNSGDLQFYEWRFPLLWEAEIRRQAAANQLDPAWVYGTIRSESAMLETARSPANAMGLMQLLPATARQVARKHGLAWTGSAQLNTVSGNLPLGTAYMGDLLRQYRSNPVLVSGSYNAGPRAVDQWLDTRPLGEAAIWIETLPYAETRDYIPRVLAFTTIYEWRLGGPVRRVSDRMPHIESGKIDAGGFTSVVCREPVR